MLKYSLLLAAALLATPAAGQDLSKCSAIERPLERLDCYDTLAKPGASNPYRSMSIDDFKLDHDTLKDANAKVQLFGLLRQMGELAMLSKGVLDQNPLFVETKSLPREQRKALLDRCAAGCDVVARGHVDKVFTGNGLVLESVTILGQ